METGEFWRLGRVSDERLRSGLAELLASGYRTEARIIAHIAEVEQRKLHLRDGSESMFDYCISRLGLSSSEAFHRLTASRIARRFPIVFRLIEKRKLHLTGVCLLRDYLSEENHRELLAAAQDKTKLQIQEMLATRFPRPDVESRIRKLPTPAQSAVPSPAAPTAPVASSAVASPELPVRLDAAPASSAVPRTQTAQPLPQMPVRGLIQSTSEARYRIQLNASAALKEKLDLLQALTSHANSSGDLAVLIERAVDLALEEVQRRRFAKTDRPREPQRSLSVKAKRSLLRRDHIANATRREVVARDGLRCAFVGEGGHRCTARAFLQIHHEHAWARGGSDDAGNLRVLCGRHNRLLGEQDFGAKRIARTIDARRIALNSQSPSSSKPAKTQRSTERTEAPDIAQHPPQDTSGRFALTRSVVPRAKPSPRSARE